jgi:hypothetical protein
MYLNRFSRRERAQLAQAWIEIMLRYPLHHVFTFTFGQYATRDGAERAMKQFISRLESLPVTVWCWWTYEVSKGGDGHGHIHGVIGGTDLLGSDTIRAQWRGGQNYAQLVEPYCVGSKRHPDGWLAYITKGVRDGTGEMVPPHLKDLDKSVERWRREREAAGFPTDRTPLPANRIVMGSFA